MVLETMPGKIRRMTDDLACALMTAPLCGGNDCGCAAMIHHEPPAGGLHPRPARAEVIVVIR